MRCAWISVLPLMGRGAREKTMAPFAPSENNGRIGLIVGARRARSCPFRPSLH
jgi:hypothetical protein